MKLSLGGERRLVEDFARFEFTGGHVELRSKPEKNQAHKSKLRQQF